MYKSSTQMLKKWQKICNEKLGKIAISKEWPTKEVFLKHFSITIFTKYYW